MTSEQPHVLIAGGGPVGLLAAINLCQQGIRTTMVERETRERLVHFTNGTGFQMYACSNYILKRLGLYETAISLGREWDSLEMHDAEEKTIKTFWVQDVMKRETPLGKLNGSTTASRFVLAKIFLDKLDEYVSKGLFTIHFKTQVSGYEQIGDNKVALLAKKEGEDIRLEGDFLLGCDGVHSRIRKQVMKDMKITDDYLVDTGITTYWGKFEVDDKEGNTKAIPMEEFIGRNASTTRGYGRVGGPKNPAYFIWGHGPASTETRKDGIVWSNMVRTTPEKKNDFDPFNAGKNVEVDIHNRGARKGEVIKNELLKQSPPNSIMEAIVKNTDADRVLKTNLLYHSRMEAPYSFGRVILLGDAVHPESPAGGQGLNMGLVDAYVVPLYLAGGFKSEPSNVRSVLNEYANAKTRKQINEIAHTSFTITDLSMGKNWWFYTLLKPVLKLFSVRLFLGDMLLKAEDLNFSRVYKAENFATSKGIQLEGVTSI